MLRTVFLGTPDFAAVVLKGLCAHYAPPVGVFTQAQKPRGRGQKVTPTPVEAEANQLGLPCWAVENINAPECLEQLAGLKPDLIVVAAFGQLLKKVVLNLPPKGCLNVHGSLLPAYRGAAPVQMAIWDGLTTTGVTIQRMVSKLDAGDIVVQKTMAIGPQETSGELMNRMAPAGAEALVEAVRAIEQGTAQYRPQDESKVSLAPKLTKEMAWLDWTLPAQAIVCRVRALNPWPSALGKLGTEPVKIHRAVVVEGAPKTPPGSLHTDHRSYLHVGCADGQVALTEVQAENRKRLEIREFLAAYRGKFPHTQMGVP